MADETDLETYKAQLEQVEAALLIDENNEDLLKLKQDLLEVISLSEELEEINEIPEGTSYEEPKKEEKHKWKQGDRVQAERKADGKMHNAKIEMIADDGLTCVVKFDNIGAVEVVQITGLQGATESTEPSQEASSSTTNPQGQQNNTQKQQGKLTREELERRKEIKKKKLLKKKQRMKDFEEKRESEKNRWQSFFKKGTSGKGKGKVKGLNKKSIFASREDGKGKIGVGTCGTSGKQMTTYTPASQYMYKK